MRRIVLLISLSLITFQLSMITATAQSKCGIENIAFQSGERLTYDLYFNWKFVWVKVGKATMNTDLTTYQGQRAWKASLVTGGNSKLDKFFTMRDTLLSYCNTELAPVYFRKGAREGKRYYVDELWFTYPNNTCKLKMHHISSHGQHMWKDAHYKDCIYDMMSIFLRARNFKMNGTKEKFRCLVFSFYERENGKSHELIRFYITDDQNHIPVRLDMFLSFGSAKAYLNSYKGVRSPMTSKIK